MDKTKAPTMKNLYGNKGQALLFVVVALTISTVVGVSVATRTLSVSKRVSSTDTYAKVYYAAEAGIERFLVRPTDELEALASGMGVCSGHSETPMSYGHGCSFVFGAGTSVQTLTEVTVEKISYNESEPEDHYSVDVRNGTFSGVSLLGYSGASINLCWRNKLSGVNTAIYYTLWDPASLMSKAILLPAGGVSLPFSTSGGVIADSYSLYYGDGKYSWCEQIPVSGASFINVMALGGDATIGFFPAPPAVLPPQGYIIRSKATLAQGSQVQVTKVLEAVRSYNHVPGFFDAAIYTQDDIDLSVDVP